MYRELEKIAGPPAVGSDDFARRLLQREKEMAAARGLEYSPGMRMSGKTPGMHPVLEKEVIKGTGPSLGEKVKSHTVGRLRRAWMIPGKYRWLRRAGILGGVAGVGLLGKKWVESARNQKALEQQRVGDVLQKYSTQFDYIPNAPVTPKPPKFPKVPAPMKTNAGVSGVPKPGKAPSVGSNSQYTGESGEAKTATVAALLTKAAFLDSGATPWIAGAGGGIGGYLFGKKVIDPVLDMGQENLRRKIHLAERMIGGLEKGKKVAPFAGATVGALLLAAIAAKRAKQKERETMAKILAMGGTEREGFYPEDRRSISDPEAAYYG